MVTVSNHYKSLKCFTKMLPEYQVIFDKLVLFYGKKLNTHNPVSPIYYTLHNFDQHCFNIMKYVSEIILSGDVSYSQEYGLNSEELYLLNLSILFHDYSMTTINFSRDKHSTESGDIFDNEFQTDTVLRSESNLSLLQVRIIRSIIEYHSNSKSKNNYNSIKKTENGQIYKIRVELLAAILRFADELDITSSRIGSEIQFENLDLKIESQKESSYHWRCLKMFLNLYSEQPCSNIIKLEIDDSFYESEKKNNNANDALGIIKSKYNKIASELTQFRKVVDSYDNVRTFIHIEKVELISERNSSEVIEYSIDNDNLIEREQVLVIEKVVTEPYIFQSSAPSLDIQYSRLINIDICKKIRETVISNKLIDTGHFLMNSRYCARDWIDTRSLINDKDISKSIVNYICKHIVENNYNENSIIVGIGLEGLILSSKVGVSTQIDFTYVMPKTSRKHSDEHEISIKNYTEKYIFVIDAISTYTTINEIIELYSINPKDVIAIYAVIFRMPGCRSLVDDKYELSNVCYTLNDTFNTELFEKSKCYYKENCIGSNRIGGLI